MKVLFSVGHPGHVHLFKNLIWALQKKGHECKILASDKDVSISLLNAYSLDYTLAGNSKTSSFLLKVFGQLKTEHSLYKVAKKLKPDILVGGPGGLSVSHIGKILKIPSIVSDDTEHSKLEHYLMDPFAT
ncbi:MAG: hypothetical protein PHU28_06190, partial [Methanosarcinaceae archaeon]|nr:hypothetical protein [Methanosarcinaceae archaeon]